jgi:hypothetical protein
MPLTKFYLLPMSPIIVLGLSFLKQRAITIDFASLRLKFKRGNQEHEVLGHTQSEQQNCASVNNLKIN